MFKRRKKLKTDYGQRMALLKSGSPRIVVRRALKNIHVQIIRYNGTDDEVCAEAITRELRKYGWNSHGGNLSSAYLTGLLAGLKARKAGVESVIADIGLQNSVKCSSLYAAVLGAKDAGLKIPIGKDALPDRKRIRGEHVAAYATLLKKDRTKYQKQFSIYLKNNFDPEKLPEHFDEVKNKMLSEHNIKALDKKEDS